MKFSNLELSEWIEHPSGWCRYTLALAEDGSKYHKYIVVMIYTKMLIDNKNQTKFMVTHVRFYDSLYELDELYNSSNVILDWDLDFAKNSVDRFLTRINNIATFL